MTTKCASMFEHLDAMTDDRGLFEHAERAQRRVTHGYCTDDNARMLVVTARESDNGPAKRLSRIALAFTIRAQAPDGRSHNRMSPSGGWTDGATTNDWWGRSLWGLGVAATSHGDAGVRASALTAFNLGTQQRSRWPRAMAFAALGAADVLVADPANVGARTLLRDAVVAIGVPASDGWAWPEARLTYANASLAEALIAAGASLFDDSVLERGLRMLGWLLDRETTRGHLSVTGVGGCGPTDLAPQFDQQPIEVAAMADACWRAHAVTGDSRWSEGVAVAAAWFDGANDSDARMRDDVTGGGFDGLLVDGVNLNQGAESTLALISTRQRAHSVNRVVS